MYRTRSDTQKLQRLIDFLKERGSDSAANLETSAQDFLNDVKPKYRPGDIPFYDGDDSSCGSSFVEQNDQDDDWDDDWEEWEDCNEELPEVVPPRIPTPTVIPPPSVPITRPSEVPPKIPEVPKIVTISPPPQNVPKCPSPTIPKPIASSQKISPTPSLRSSRYKPSVVLSGVEKSSEIATPLIKFPTLPVSIPNFFSNEEKNGKNKKKSKVPEENAVESFCVDSLTVAAAVVVPQIDPNLTQKVSK